MRIPGEILDEALKKPDDGIFEYLCTSIYCDSHAVKIKKVPFENFQIALKLCPETWTEFMFLAVRSSRLDIIDYILSLKIRIIYDYEWSYYLEEGGPGVIFLLLKHYSGSDELLRGSCKNVLFKHAGDERVDQVIRRVFHGFPGSGKHNRKLLKIQELQRGRKKVLGEVCMRKNIPLYIQFNIFQFIKI